MGDIDFDGGILRVQRTLNVINSHLVLAEPKTETSRRKNDPARSGR